MTTKKVGSGPRAAIKLAKPVAKAPKTSFADTLAAQTDSQGADQAGSAQKNVVQGRTKPVPDQRDRAREQQIMEQFALHQAQSSQQQVQSGLAMAKQAKNKEDKAKGGLEGE